MKSRMAQRSIMVGVVAILAILTSAWMLEEHGETRTLYREAARVELEGVFQGGDVERVVFRLKGRDFSCQVLENLARERVAENSQPIEIENGE